MKNLTIEFKTSEKLSVICSLDEIFKQMNEVLYERLGEQVPCGCNINESTPYHECGDPFEDKKVFITGFVIRDGKIVLTDNSSLNEPF